MSGYMKVLAEYSDKAGHKDRTGHIKRITGIITAIIMLITTAVIVPVFCCAEEVSGPDIDTPSAILMEAATGQVIYEKDADTVLAPASIISTCHRYTLNHSPDTLYLSRLKEHLASAH